MISILMCMLLGVQAAERQALAQDVQRPNVLFILTDDQAPEDLAGMSKVQNLLVDQGTSFSHAFATTPACCPSRVSFMRGQYVHNHGVLTNDETPIAGYDGFIELGLQNSTIATWLHDAGYATFYAGKFLNGYKGTTYVPPGWDKWYAFSDGRPNETRYTVNENGTLKTYAQDKRHDTYYLRDKTEAFIRSRVKGRPWFAWVSTHAPHGPITIAPEFQGSYDSVEMPKPPSYNEADVSDKPAWIRWRALIDDDCSTYEDPYVPYACHEQVAEKWRARQESLMSVDVMVEDLVNALAETNQLERTYIVFASDNGFLLGQHRLYSKGGPYEENQGIPFVVRGPGVQQGVVSEELVANIDLAPTIAGWAGVEVPTHVDGRSFVPLLEGTTATWRQYLLFEQFHKHYAGVRTARGETYVEHETGEKEYYDLTIDPWQLESAHSAPENAQRIAVLSARLSNLKSCAGATCRAADGGL